MSDLIDITEDVCTVNLTNTTVKRIRVIKGSKTAGFDMERIKDFYTEEDLRKAFVSGVEAGLKTSASKGADECQVSYADCANAMLKMWIDKVLTDSEYNRIMDRLNACELRRRKKHE